MASGEEPVSAGAFLVRRIKFYTFLLHFNRKAGIKLRLFFFSVILANEKTSYFLIHTSGQVILAYALQ
jgi:hypothetical protein